MEPVSATTPFDAPEPPADRYCRDLLSSEIASDVGLYSSTNLFVKAAPALPPDRYASLITTPVPFVLAKAGTAASEPKLSAATQVSARAPMRLRFGCADESKPSRAPSSGAKVIRLFSSASRI